MRAFITSFHAARRDHPWMVPGVAIAASAALGIALQDIVAFAERVLS